MTEQQRESFRVDTQFEAEVFHHGRVVSCTVQNLSAGGALVETSLEMPAGAHCTLGLALEGDLATATGLPYVSFHMEVLAAQPVRGGLLTYRLRNVTSSGSKEYETATKLVFAAQASPMASDPDRRGRLRTRMTTRFGRGSLRPGSDED